MCAKPKLARDRLRLNTGPGPPIHFLAGAVQLAVVGAAERHGKFIADLLRQPAGLGKAKVMGIAGLPPADQAGLPGNKAQVLLVAQSAGLSKDKQALVNPSLRLWSTDFPVRFLGYFFGCLGYFKGRQPRLKRPLDPLLVGGCQRVCLSPDAQCPGVQVRFAIEAFEFG